MIAIKFTIDYIKVQITVQYTVHNPLTCKLINWLTSTSHILNHSILHLLNARENNG